MNRFKTIINLYLVIITNILRKITIFSSKTHLVRRVAFHIFANLLKAQLYRRLDFWSASAISLLYRRSRGSAELYQLLRRKWGWNRLITSDGCEKLWSLNPLRASQKLRSSQCILWELLWCIEIKGNHLLWPSWKCFLLEERWEQSCSGGWNTGVELNREGTGSQLLHELWNLGAMGLFGFTVDIFIYPSLLIISGWYRLTAKHSNRTVMYLVKFGNSSSSSHY